MRAALALLLAVIASPAWAQADECSVVIQAKVCAASDHPTLRAPLLAQGGDGVVADRVSSQRTSSPQLRGGAAPAAEGSERAWKWADDAWWGRDKALHFSASFLLTTNGQYVLVNKLDASEDASLPVSAASALAVGIAKEVYDARRVNGSGFSLRDLAWDAAGIAAAALLVAL